MKKTIFRRGITLLMLFCFGISVCAQQWQRPTQEMLQSRINFKSRPAASLPNRTAACSNDSLVFTRQSQIDSFPITNPACTVLRKLRIDGNGATPAITRLDSLRYITQVTEEFEITHTDVIDLSGLTGLTALSGSASINQNLLMTSISLPVATNMSQLIVLTLDNLPELTSIASLINNVRNDYPQILNIVQTGLPNLTGLDSLHTTDLFVGFNHHLQSLHGLEGLRSVNFYMSIIVNDSLTNLSGLSNLDSMVYQGAFDFSGNPMLTDLSGLSHLSYIEGGLHIHNNDNLTSLAGLNPSLFIHGYGGDSLLIYENGQLSVCGFPPICDAVNRLTNVRIENNAPGCTNITEVQVSCLGDTCTGGIMKTWNGSASIYWDNPANWTPAGEPNICDTVLIPSALTNYPQLTGNVSVHGLIMQPGSSMDCQFATHFSIAGNLVMDSASIEFADSVIVSKSNTINLNQSNFLFGNNLIIDNYSGPVDITGSAIQANIFLSDSSSRQGVTNINGNTINGDLSIVSNTTDPASAITIATTGDNNIFGNTLLTTHSTIPFQVGNETTGKFMKISGDLIVNSNYAGHPALRNVLFVNTSGSSHVTQSGTTPIHFYDAGIPGIMLIPDNDVHIDHSFHFESGRVKTDSNKLLIFENNASWYITNLGSYTWGPVKKVGNQSFYFPVGDSLYQRPFAMSAPAQPTDAYTAEYAHTNPSLAGYDTSLHASSLGRILSREYWTLNRTNGNSKVKLDIDYDTSYTGPISSPYDLRLARWNGSQWENLGAASVEVFNDHSGRLHSDSLSSFGVFALAVAPHRIPLITISPADTIACAAFVSPSMYHFTLDTLMLSSNTFRLQISDSSGSFAIPYQLGEINSNHSDSLLGFIPSNYPYGEHYKIRVVGNAPPDTSASQTLKVIPFPSSSLTVHGSTTGCIGGGVYKYYVTPFQQGVIYNWGMSGGGGTFTTNNDTAYVTWTSTGIHFLSVTNANRCIPFVGFANIGVTVSPPPPAATPTINNTGRWLYSSVPAASQNSLGYHWYRNDTLISGANNSSYYAASAGTYKVRYYNLCGESPASNSISFAAASLPQTISFPAIPNHTYGDPDFAINATTTSGLPVSFAITSGPGTLPANVYHITTTGSVTIKATQPGDNIYDTAAPVSQTFTISKASQTISFPAISDEDIAASAQFSLNAASSSGLNISYAVISGPATISGGTVTLTGLGTVTIRATQAGDTNYLAATPVDRSFCVRVSQVNHITGPVSICPGINATYSTNNISGATYTWRIAGGSTLSSTTNSVTYAWPSPGSYTLIVSAAGSCGAASNNDSLNVTAITSVSPDSVNTMLPANGAINQQLPLTLSWIPANPALYYTYDLYVWRSDLPQPGSPYVANLTSINYTIPLNSGLQYGQTYKWMIVAHNGSCTVATSGPIQTFSLIPLPDLQVFNVTAPSAALSGQPVSVTWKVKNNGPGNTQTGQQWTDAVFISVDSILNLSYPASIQFPAAPKLVATKANVTSLNSGQQYNDTATFTIPVTYSGPLYMHVITNYAPPFSSPLIENTLINDTAHALPSTAVTLAPQPDLRVDTVTNPNNTFSGSTINVTYKVKNYNVNATGSWVDKIYISKDAIFNINTAILLKYPTAYGTYYPTSDMIIPHSNGLQQDSSYTISLQAVVPNFIYGNYYVYVFTNANGNLYEGPNNNNNVSHGNLMQVFLTPTPKLVPQAITLATNVSTTQAVPVTWTDQNQGAYDNLQAFQGHYWQTFTHNCGPGNNNLSYHDNLGPGASAWVDKVYISTDSSGLNNNANLVYSYQQGNPNAFIPVGPYPDRYCQVTVPANVNTYPAIVPNSGYTAAYTYAVPDTLSQGDYYIYVLSNATKTVFEFPGNPQVARSNKFTVTWPDLTVPSVSVPTTGNSGQPITVSYSIINAGPGAVYNHYRKDYIYMGNNSVFDGTAIKLDSIIYNAASVPVGNSQALQKTIILPNGVSGVKYFYVKTNADSSFKEISLSNNTSNTGALINITLTPPPDLQVTSINITDTIWSVLGFPFKYTVTNTGSGLASGSWKDSLFISCNSSFNSSSAYFIGLRTHQEYLPATVSYSDSFNLVLPITAMINHSGCMANDTPHVYFFVRTNSNNGIYEPVTNNNTTATSQKILINALVDHTITEVASTDSAWVGQHYKIRWTVKNLGYNPNDYSYYNWTDDTYFTTDSLGNNAQLIGFKGEGLRLNHNQSYTDSLNSIVPNLPTGYYYLFVNTNCNNEIFGEHRLSNNPGLRRNASGQAIRVYVTNNPPSDLADSIITAPSSAAAGQPVKVVYRIKNIGQAITTPSSWFDDYWLSNSLSASGLYFGHHWRNGALLPGQSYIDSFFINIPVNQPPGNYTIVSRTGVGNVYESNYSNNLGFRYISVYTPLPTDLVVGTISVVDTLVLGKPANVNWNLSNISNNPANGFETDGVYLSNDSLTSSNNDILIGTKQNNLGILPLASSAISAQPAVSGVTEGSYFLKVKTDIQNNIPETDKLNNTGIRTNRVYVKVRQLPFNVNVPDTLQAAYFYYKLIVPAALAGKTIKVSLTSNDSLIANNQLYIGLGYIPSAAHFDYTYNNANYGNQQIVIESVVDSVYYISAKGTRPGQSYQLVNLKAIELPFAISSVNANHGGNTGNVTVQIKGSLFTNNMIARLHPVSSGADINASTIYFINSTTVYATFNLAAKPLGLYDVILKKPDSSAAILPSSFTIELTNNGGLITGGGGNTGQTGSGNAPGCDPGAASGLNSQLQTELIIPPHVFASWPFVIQINYTNTSNVDIPAQIRILYSQNGAPLSLTEAGLADNKTTLYIEFKDATGPPNMIRAGGTGTVRVYSKAPANAQAHSFLNYSFQ